MSKMRFKLVEGKHQMEDGSFIRGPKEVDLEVAYAARFPNKFVPVAVQAEAEAEPKKEEPPVPPAKK
jgi:hypothetical protein